MSNVITPCEVEGGDHAGAQPAQIPDDQSRSSFDNWNAIVASFEQMRDALDILMPAGAARELC
jgi:hypothetical protein